MGIGRSSNSTGEEVPPPGAGRGLTVDRVAGAVLVLFALAVAWQALGLPLGSLANPGPGYVPLALAAALAAAGLAIALFDRGSRPWRAVRWTEARHALGILAACAFSALALERLGFRATVFALVAFLLGALERRRLLAVAVAAFALAAGTHYLFATLLKVPLPRGPWGL
jgi:putative tricarboxylic transport membrane protein